MADIAHSGWDGIVFLSHSLVKAGMCHVEFTAVEQAELSYLHRLVLRKVFPTRCRHAQSSGDANRGDVLTVSKVSIPTCHIQFLPHRVEAGQ